MCYLTLVIWDTEYVVFVLDMCGYAPLVEAAHLPGGTPLEGAALGGVGAGLPTLLQGHLVLLVLGVHIIPVLVVITSRAFT